MLDFENLLFVIYFIILKLNCDIEQYFKLSMNV